MKIAITSHRWSRSSHLALWVGVGGVLIGTAVGILAGAQPLYLGVALAAIAILVYFFTGFEQAVIGLLLLRSCVDVFSAQQIPAVFAAGLDALTLLYVTVMLLTGRTVRTDGFWWFFASWVMLQGLWLVLLALGGLGLDASYLLDGIREWVRLFSWLMVYLLVMQLKNRIHPEKIISLLFLSLVLPLTAALMQTLLPASLLPSILVYGGNNGNPTPFEVTSRINATFGHPNVFATFLLLFIGLTYWKMEQSKQRAPWILLLGTLVFFLVGTKALFSLMMLGVFILVLITPRLSLPHLIGGVLLFALVIGLFASTQFGQQRLSSIANTPLLNPDIDISRAILLSQGDNNSFNWRINQWTHLLKSWQEFPILGFGLGTSNYVSGNGIPPHNDYIRALVEGGILGFVTFVTFLGAQVLRLVQLIRSAPYGSAQHSLRWVLLAIFLALILGMTTDNIWSHTALFYYWFTGLAVASWNWDEVQPLKKL